jgi:hypothetical protein
MLTNKVHDKTMGLHKANAQARPPPIPITVFLNIKQ